MLSAQCPDWISAHKWHHLTRPSWVGGAGCSKRMLPVESEKRTLLGRSSLEMKSSIRLDREPGPKAAPPHTPTQLSQFFFPSPS